MHNETEGTCHYHSKLDYLWFKVIAMSSPYLKRVCLYIDLVPSYHWPKYLLNDTAHLKRCINECNGTHLSL